MAHDFVAQSDTAKEVFEEASETLAIDMEALCF